MCFKKVFTKSWASNQVNKAQLDPTNPQIQGILKKNGKIKQKTYIIWVFKFFVMVVKRTIKQRKICTSRRSNSIFH